MNRTAKPLSSRDCYHLGVEAQRSEDYGLAMEWLQRALRSQEDAQVRYDALMELSNTHYLVGGISHSCLSVSQSVCHSDKTNVTTTWTCSNLFTWGPNRINKVHT